jgi:PEP-CTERM motif
VGLEAFWALGRISEMRKMGLIVAIASLATGAALWTLPAAAHSGNGSYAPHDRWIDRSKYEHEDEGSDSNNNRDNDCDDRDDRGCAKGVPEPDTLLLFAVGLGAVGAYSVLGMRRRRVKA